MKSKSRTNAKPQREGLFFMIAGVALIAMTYVLFISPQTSVAGKVVPEKSVGNLKVEFVPYPAAPGLETVAISYDGAGQFDISNWELSDATGVVATIASNTVLLPGEEVTLCADGSPLPGCTTGWTGDVWEDETGVLNFGALAAEAPFISFTYENNENSVVLGPQREIIAPLYGTKDRVDLCHLHKPGEYKTQADQAERIVEGVRGHAAHTGDIIPSFYYDFGTGVQYHAGMNWESAAVSPASGCE